MQRPSARLALAALVAVTIGAGTVPALGADAPCSNHQITNEIVKSKAADGIDVGITVFKPCSADAASPAPVTLHSHGWAGSRSKTGFGTELNSGMGVVSIDQRGHGETGGQANVEDPMLEAQDIKSVIDHIAAKDWVRKDLDANGKVIANDPVLFAIGGSYGGGYQMITALTETRESGRTRFNALAPEITWFDLSQSLAPNGVPRTVWGVLLYGVGAASVDMAPFIHESFAYASATGQWPNGKVLGQDDPAKVVSNLDAIYKAHSPIGFVQQGVRLDIPVIWRQGIQDGLFPMNEGVSNFRRTFTSAAQGRSIFVGFNGGHVLPSTLPANGTLAGDACSPGGFGPLTRSFFKAVADGIADPAAALMAANPVLARYNLTTDDGKACVRLGDLPAPTSVGVGQDVDLTVTKLNDAWMTTTGPGAPVQLELPGIAPGSTVAGIPVLSGKVAVLGVDQRAFFGLSKGTSIADAKLLAANVQPLRVATPSTSVTESFSIELPGVAVKLAPGEKLFLTVASTSDQFIGHSSRTGGWMGFTDLKVALPVVG